MRQLSLPLALTARLSPVVVLAAAGWALTSGPFAPASDAQPQARGQNQEQTENKSASAPSTSAASKTYTAAPDPCDSVAAKTVTALVPGAKKDGKEIPSTDTKLRRTCSWNALKGYDYRWLDVSFEIKETDEAAQKAFKDRVADKSGGGDVPGVGDAGYSVVNLTTEDKQETREGVVLVRVSNALVVVTYNGSDFETKKAPSTDEINKGAIKAAKDAVAALGNGQ
ncbi:MULTISPECIES: hypothetical protein [Streptomyces]|uniref:DUF3558 domain-containing protein n=1 Tax=Streptomyces fuscus TaxID=3048495 RepID=A0ABT7IWN2_9ACTN|nr:MULTISPECIES: hypothetical protein [Streptomyces]MCM1973902.1 hypothetical protein [Streptomyces sp. G1]MDL2076999.1 hypothetical protein [Streptomyces fuscus]SBT89882.1 hypothetical protein GA0115233_101330 [Streptomyces sp. DI166]